MSIAGAITTRVAELVGQRVPFVLATVVRAEMPTSARPGDAAIIRADGSMEGFVGGQCAESSVQVAALDVLDAGEPLLLRILPGSAEEFPERPGARTVVNPCLSGGAIEVFLDPKLPAAIIAVVGSTPIAEAIVYFGTRLGYAVDHVPNGVPTPSGALAVVISSHGRHEEESIAAAVAAGVGFIGLVASHGRGAAVLASLDLDDAARAAIHSPVGLDIGARTAEEVALSVLAELTRSVRVDGLVAAPTAEPARPVDYVDPICGMTVIVTDATPHLRHDGRDHWYCNVGCRARHVEELAIGVDS